MQEGLSGHLDRIQKSSEEWPAQCKARGGESKVNFEKARLSQAEADHEIQGDRKYRGKDRENTTGACLRGFLPGQGSTASGGADDGSAQDRKQRPHLAEYW